MTNREEEFKEYLRQLGAQGGRKAAQNMTEAQRIARAKKAVAAREAKRKGTPTSTFRSSVPVDADLS